jgi:outer membrane lipoprotein SlyB
MMADTLDELHEMADCLGLKREWFQGDHYDISKSKRVQAVKLGAIETTSRDLVKRFRKHLRN